MLKPDRSAKVMAGFPGKFSNNKRGNARAMALLTLVTMAGVTAGVFLSGCNKAATRPPEPQAEQPAGYVLSDGTKAVLRQLASPVEIKFYALLDSTYAPDAMKNLATSAEALLSACEQESGGKLTVKRSTTLSKESTDTAAKDGLKALDLAQGDPSFLGLVVAGREKREVLPLLPEWEPAMESDLARAIARVAAMQTLLKAAPADPVAAARIMTEISRLIPDVKATSLDDGLQRLRESALNEFKAAAAEMKQQVEAAQQRLSEAQSDADKQAALKQAQQIQLEQGAKLKEIGARLQDEIEKFQQLKQAAGN